MLDQHRLYIETQDAGAPVYHRINLLFLALQCLS